MAFYIVVKGRLTAYQFQYLDDSAPVRLERTIIHGTTPPKGRNKREVENLQREVFAVDVMTKGLISLSPAATIREAKELMENKKIHHIPLLIDKRLTGLISKHDIPESDNILAQEIRLDKVMSKMVLCASETTPLRHVAEVFMKENINSLPIVDDDLIVTGIITHRDLLRWLLENNRFQNQ